MIDVVYRGMRLRWPHPTGVLIGVRRPDGGPSYGTVPLSASWTEQVPDVVTDAHLRRVADTYLYLYAAPCNQSWDGVPWEIHLIDDPTVRAAAETAYHAEHA